MTEAFWILLWLGGALERQGRGIGFWKSIIWPYYAGRWISWWLYQNLPEKSP